MSYDYTHRRNANESRKNDKNSDSFNVKTKIHIATFLMVI